MKISTYILFAALLLWEANQAHGAQVQFLKKDTIANQNTITDTLFFEVPYISIEFLEKVFQSEGTSIPIRQKYILTDFFQKQWYITVDNPYLVREGEIYNLVYPIRRSANHLFVPIVPVLDILNKLYSVNGSYNKKTNTIRLSTDSLLVKPVSEGGPNILSFKKTDLENGVLLELKLTQKLKYQALSVLPNYLISFSKGRLSPALLEPQRWTGLVRSLTTIQEDSSAQITLQILDKIDSVETHFQEEDSTFAILIRKKTAAPKVEPKPKKTTSKEKTIIIDPGHGGTDPGAVYKGVNEKDITLSIAKKLKKILVDKGYKVLMTRDRDTLIALRDRPKFASENSGSIFISLHCNAISGTPKKLKDVEGFVAYILRAGESEEDKALARRENQAIEEAKKETKKDLSPVDWILLEHELNLYSHQSEMFAEEIVKNFKGGVINKHRTGAHQAGFFVLVGAFMPAVLFEMGFLTNDKDRAYMMEPKGQTDIAQRLSKSIINFLNKEQ